MSKATIPSGRIIAISASAGISSPLTFRRSHDAVIRACDEAGNVIERQKPLNPPNGESPNLGIDKLTG